MNTTDRLRIQAGFTLIELLVAMAVSLVVLYATLQLFEKSQKSYVVQEEVAETQQNVRIAKMFLERDIRMAGAGIPDFSFAGAAVYPFEFENNINGSAGRAKDIVDDGHAIVAGTDLLVVRYNNFNATPCGTDGVSDSCDDLPQLQLAVEMTSTDVVAATLESLAAGGAGENWSNNCYCNGTTYTPSTPYMPFVVAATDGSKSAVLFLTGTDTSPDPDELGNAAVTIDGTAYTNRVLNTFPVGSTVNFFPPDGLYEALYYIEDRSGIPCLVRDTGSGGQVIAEYIEDMQFSFALDTNGDGAVDTNMNSGNLTDAQKPQVRMVTLNLLSRSPHQHRENHREHNGQRPAIEDHSAGAADSYRRRQITVKIKVRNLGI